MTKLILIFLGSGIGGVVRFALNGWVPAWTTDSFPLGTLAVNTIGCFAIGMLSGAFGAAEAGALGRDELRAAITIGLIGGFTTFSAFSKETIALAGDGEMMMAAVNVILSAALGLDAVCVGTRLAESFAG